MIVKINWKLRLPKVKDTSSERREFRKTETEGLTEVCSSNRDRFVFDVRLSSMTGWRMINSTKLRYVYQKRRGEMKICQVVEFLSKHLDFQDFNQGYKRCKNCQRYGNIKIGDKVRNVESNVKYSAKYDKRSNEITIKYACIQRMKILSLVDVP